MYAATLVATTLLISRSSLYYRKQPRGSRDDRRFDDAREAGEAFRDAEDRDVEPLEGDQQLLDNPQAA